MKNQNRYDVDVTEIKRLYADGKSTVEIGKLLGCSYQTVNRRLKASGVNLRSVGVPRKYDEEKILELHELGYSSNQIDKIIGASHGQSSYYLRRLGISPGKGNCYQRSVSRICPECGKTFETRLSDKVYCSQTCRSARSWRNRNDQKRANTPGEVDEIGLHELYERDGGVCHICGGMTDWDDFSHTDDGYFLAGDNYPSRDHVIPLAKGGTHTWDNVKLAHFRCNTLKRDNMPELELAVMANA